MCLRSLCPPLENRGLRASPELPSLCQSPSRLTWPVRPGLAPAQLRPSGRPTVPQTPVPGLTPGASAARLGSWAPGCLGAARAAPAPPSPSLPGVVQTLGPGLDPEPLHAPLLPRSWAPTTLTLGFLPPHVWGGRGWREALPVSAPGLPSTSPAGAARRRPREQRSRGGSRSQARERVQTLWRVTARGCGQAPSRLSVQDTPSLVGSVHPCSALQE